MAYILIQQTILKIGTVALKKDSPNNSFNFVTLRITNDGREIF